MGVGRASKIIEEKSVQAKPNKILDEVKLNEVKEEEQSEKASDLVKFGTEAKGTMDAPNEWRKSVQSILASHKSGTIRMNKELD